MKLLLTGVRGVGKSTVGTLTAQTTGFPFWGISDLLRKELPDFAGSSYALRTMLEALPVQERAEVYHQVISVLRGLEHVILEMPIVECGPFGMMIPREPVLRLVPFDAFILLEADPSAIHKRRNARPPKKQDPRFLTESATSIAAHQELCREMIICLGATLLTPVFIIPNDNDPAHAVQAVVAATKAAQHDAEFHALLRAMS
jgi:adenylate kinase